MADTSACPFKATRPSSSSKPSSSCINTHADQPSTMKGSPSHPQNPSLTLEDAQEPSRLEQLPSELRRYLLATLDLDQLKSLIKSSPTFYQQYRHDQRFILGRILDRELGLLAVDAYSVHLTSLFKFDPHHPKDAVTQSLKHYQRLRSSSSFSLLEQELTANEMNDMATFYLSFIQPFTEMYKAWALSKAAEAPSISETGAPDAPLSFTEQLRIMRALYRFQLWCSMFGCPRPAIDEVDLLDMFFGLYEPWEVDEINSVYEFAKNGFLTDLCWETDTRGTHIFAAADGFHIEFDSDYPWAQDEPRGEDHMKVKCTCKFNSLPMPSKMYVSQLTPLPVVRGIEMLPATSTRVTALYTSLINSINECYYSCDDHLLDVVLRRATQQNRRIMYPSARDQRERDKEPSPFRGDDPAQPPVAWTHTWEGKYSNLFGGFIPDTAVEWGLVMWDEARFRDLEGFDVVWYTCKDDWGRRDPRKMFADQQEEEDSEDDEDWY